LLLGAERGQVGGAFVNPDAKLQLIVHFKSDLTSSKKKSQGIGKSMIHE